MKLEIIHFILATLIASTCFGQVSNFQRIAIPSVSVSLTTTNSSRTVSSFCADFDRESPDYGVKNFDFVHLDERCVKIGNNVMTLQQALDQKYIEIVVDGYDQVTFVNLKKTALPISVNNKSPIIVGDVEGDNKGIVLSEDIKNTNSWSEKADIQDRYWARQEDISMLKESGYLKSNNISDVTKLKEDVKKYQIENGLTPDGLIGKKTREDLYNNIAFKKYLADECASMSTSEAIKKFQEVCSLNPSGSVDQDTGEQLWRLQKISIELKNQSLTNQYSVGPPFSFRKDNYTYVFEAGSKGLLFYKLRSTAHGFTPEQVRKPAIEDFALFEDYYQETAARNSSSSVEFVHIGMTNNKQIKLQIGRVSKIIDISQLGDNQETTLTNQIVKCIKENSQAQKIVVVRDPIARSNRVNHSNTLFTSIELANDLDVAKINPLFIIGNIQDLIPEKKIYLGGDFEKDIAALNGTLLITKSSDVVGVSGGNTFLVKEDILSEADIQSSFTKNGIKVVDTNELDELKKSESKVVVVTGNKDDNFKSFINWLGWGNELKDKIVVTFSCFEEGNDFENSSVIKLSRANSIIYFPDKIHPNAVKKVLFQFSELLSKNSEKRDVESLLQEAIELAKKTETDEFLKTEIIKLGKFSIQISNRFDYRSESQIMAA